jgi:hypothetical protein
MRGWPARKGAREHKARRQTGATPKAVAQCFGMMPAHLGASLPANGEKKNRREDSRRSKKNLRGDQET